MSARTIQCRTRGSLTTRFAIVLLAMTLLISMAPRLSGNVSAQEPRPEPTKPTIPVINTGGLTLIQPADEDEEDETDGTLVPPVATVGPGVFTLVTPEPDLPVGPVLPVDPDLLEIFDASLSGHAFECTLGLDVDTATSPELAADCGTPLDVTFTIITESGNSDYTGTDVLVNDVSILGLTSIFAQPHDGYAYSGVRAICTDVAGAVVFNDGAALGGPWFTIENNMHFDCTFFIEPVLELDVIGSVELHKWECPEDFVGADWNDYSLNCTVSMSGVEFNASLDGTDLGARESGADGPGTIIWNVDGSGELVISETIPAGYLDPVIYCGFTYTFQTEGGVAIADGLVFPDDVVGGVLTKEFQPGEMLYCDVFNRPSNEPGSVTIVKHTCAPGYDVNAPGANPWLDCPETTNGITFTLQGFEYFAQSTTGDATDGQVSFGGLIPGTYGAFETVPADTWYAFAYECVSDADGGLAPTVLTELGGDSELYIDVKPGENYTCHFMNVPNLHGGTLVVTKYWCDGEVYSVWTCDIYEDGQTFNFNGGWGWFSHTTGADGKITLFLDPGTYQLEEHESTWCFAEASNVDWEGNVIVADGETTHVNVFNCGDRPNDTPKTPGKFPNTGIEPEA